MCCKNFENRLTFKEFSVETNHGREVIIFLHNFETHITQNHHKMSQNTCMFKSRKLHKRKIYDDGLSPLLMQNPYSKFILAIKNVIC